MYLLAQAKAITSDFPSAHRAEPPKLFYQNNRLKLKQPLLETTNFVITNSRNNHHPPHFRLLLTHHLGLSLSVSIFPIDHRILCSKQPSRTSSANSHTQHSSSPAISRVRFFNICTVRSSYSRKPLSLLKGNRPLPSYTTPVSPVRLGRTLLIGKQDQLHALNSWPSASNNMKTARIPLPLRITAAIEFRVEFLDRSRHKTMLVGDDTVALRSNSAVQRGELRSERAFPSC